MRTRVIRYWHKSDWLYQVQKYVQATGAEQWIGLDCPVDRTKTPKAGEWFWDFVEGGVSRDHAERIAMRLALTGDPQLDEPDVVGEWDTESVRAAMQEPIR